MNKETKQETLDICVTAKFRDKEIAVVDLLKALLDENEKLKEENFDLKEKVDSYNILVSGYKKLKDRIDKAIEYIMGTNFYLARNSGKSLFAKYLNNLLKILKGEEVI